MAVLLDADRAALSALIQSDWSNERDTFGALTKADLRAAINAIDDWVNTNAVAFNSAIPLPARTGLTAKQKARFLLYVVRRRWEVS